MDRLYINLLKKVLIDLIYADVQEKPCFRCPQGYMAERRLEGRDFPAYAHTMMGMQRLNNLQACIEAVVSGNVPGDFIEAGIWRGGGVIFMLAMLKTLGVTDRMVWAADSFQGLPEPKLDIDVQGYGNYPLKELQVSLNQVKRNIAKYDLLSDQVQFLEGWFANTLPEAPIESLAILRLDGDLYESTLDCLTHLYPKVSEGGFIIVDDYGALKQCGEAVRDFRENEGIKTEMEWIDWTGVYWRKQ